MNIVKQNKNNSRIFTKNFVDFQNFKKFNEDRILMETNIWNFIIYKPSLGSLDVPQKIWARSVQPFWRLLDTNRQTNRQAKFIYRFRGFKVWVYAFLFINVCNVWNFFTIALLILFSLNVVIFFFTLSQISNYVIKGMFLLVRFFIPIKPSTIEYRYTRSIA